MPHISIVTLSDVQKAKRFDAEYFKLEYLEIEKKLENIGSRYLGDFLTKITGGATPLGAEYSKKGIPFLRVQNIMQNYFNEDLVYISQKQHDDIKRSELQTNDVLLTITGAYGKSAVVESRYDKANINQHSVLMRFRDGLNPYYVSTFLNCKYGSKQSDKNIVGLSRPALDYQRIKKYFLIPLFSQAFQGEIERIVKQAHEAQSQSKQLYKYAETLLLEELGLVGYEPQHRLSFETTKREVDKAQRFDAEYFQPKYDEIIDKIERYKGGFDIVQNIFNFNNTNFFPKENQFYNYIPLSKVSSTGEIEVSEQQKLGKNLPTRARRKVKKGDIILSSISGSLETSALIEEEHKNCIVSNGFYVFNSQKINSETLLVLFKSKIMIELLQRISKGTILGGYDITTFQRFKIPLICASIQEEIAHSIEKSHRLRSQSLALLKTAMQAVELAIEQGEDAASAFMQAHLH